MKLRLIFRIPDSAQITPEDWEVTTRYETVDIEASERVVRLLSKTPDEQRGEGAVLVGGHLVDDDARAMGGA